MKKISLIITTVVIIFFLQNCKKDITQSNTKVIQTGQSNSLAMKTEEGNTILGDKVANPYSLDNMKKAFADLGLSDKASKLQANRIYVKLKPETHEQVYEFLNAENQNWLISEYPIDRKVLSYGDFYVDAEAKDTILKPYYCVAFSVNDLPKVAYEILGYGYVPTDDEGEVEQRAWELAGYTTKDENGEIAYKTTAIGFYPNGTLQVVKAPSSTYVACRNKSVMATTFFKWSYMRTDNNGKFNSSVKFLVPALFYIRYWNAEYRIYGHSLIDHLGSLKKSNMGATWQIGTGDKGAWHKANLNNTVHDYNDFANTIPTHRVNNAQFWVPVITKNSASTIMMHYFGFAPHEISPADLAGPGNDFAVYSWKVMNYDWHREILFHEFSHWTHAIIAGRSYWKNVCKGEGQNIFNTLTPTSRTDYADPYRDGTQPSTSVAGNFGFTEAWAEAMGRVVSDYYGISNNQTPYSFIENVQPRAIPHNPMNGGFNLDSWYPCGLFWDLFDKNNEGNQQSTVEGKFAKDCFTLSLPYLYSKLNGATSVTDFKNNILSTTPEADKRCMTELFKAYGY